MGYADGYNSVALPAGYTPPPAAPSNFASSSTQTTGGQNNSGPPGPGFIRGPDGRWYNPYAEVPAGSQALNLGGVSAPGAGGGSWAGSNQSTGSGATTTGGSSSSTSGYGVQNYANAMTGGGSAPATGVNSAMTAYQNATNNSQQAINGMSNINSYARGTAYVPQDQVALIHRGEAVVSAAQNPYNPDNQQMRTGAGLYQGGAAPSADKSNVAAASEPLGSMGTGATGVAPVGAMPGQQPAATQVTGQPPHAAPATIDQGTANPVTGRPVRPGATSAAG